VISCGGTGQDGDLQKGAPLAYVDNGDGTITDVNTGLMWEKLDDNNVGGIHDKDNYYNWANAFAVKIATLNGGRRLRRAYRLAAAELQGADQYLGPADRLSYSERRVQYGLRAGRYGSDR